MSLIINFSWLGKILHDVGSFLQTNCLCRSIVIENLKLQTNSLNRKKIGVAFFYFDNHDPNDQEADDFVRSLLKQLVYQSKFCDLPDTLGKMYDRQISMGDSAEPTRDQFVSRLAECFAKFDTVFVVIDAFDECADNERPKILADLQRLSGMAAHKLRLFLTGRTHVFETPELRNDDQLQLWLRDASMQPIHASQDDIVLYLTTTLEKRAKGPEYEELRSRVVSEISSRADGQYGFSFVHH
jgi:hypothetical protein